jgi:hypothetical protein
MYLLNIYFSDELILEIQNLDKSFLSSDLGTCDREIESEDRFNALCLP